MKKLILASMVFLIAAGSAFAKDLTDKDFDQAISKGKNLVEFYSPNCAICKKTALIVDEYEKKNGEIFRLDLMANRVVAERYRPMNFPVFIVFQDGNEVGRFERPKSVTEIEDGFMNPKPLPQQHQRMQQGQRQISDGELAANFFYLNQRINTLSTALTFIFFLSVVALLIAAFKR